MENMPSRTVRELLEKGFIMLDKWQGPTSREVANVVKKLLGAKRAGHSGTLDPMVSGVMLITLNNGCKLMPALQGLDKKYVGVMRLHRDVDDNALHEAVERFTGTIRQRPPVKSAVARKERERTIYKMEIMDRKGRDACISIECEAGTYIRKLFDDIGKQIGGAHMKELRRTAVGSFNENDAHTMQEIAKAYGEWKSSGKEENIRKILLPVESAVGHLKKIMIKDSAVRSMANGSPVYAGGVDRIDDEIKGDELVAIMSREGALIALGKATGGKRGAVAKTDRVIL